MKTAQELIEELELMMIQLVNHDNRHKELSPIALVFLQMRIKIYQEILGVRNPVQLGVTLNEKN
jgi:hypothetical protein